jgi:hypothetical protein
MAQFKGIKGYSVDVSDEVLGLETPCIHDIISYDEIVSVGYSSPTMLKNGVLLVTTKLNDYQIFFVSNSSLEGFLSAYLFVSKKIDNRKKPTTLQRIDKSRISFSCGCDGGHPLFQRACSVDVIPLDDALRINCRGTNEGVIIEYVLMAECILKLNNSKRVLAYKKGLEVTDAVEGMRHDRHDELIITYEYFNSLTGKKDRTNHEIVFSGKKCTDIWSRTIAGCAVNKSKDSEES